MSGQSLSDRLAAAQHSVTGSAVAKAVCKASTHQMQGPKQKHLDYLIHCTNELNMSIPQLADTLLERTTSSSWVVVFKALITTHHLMMYGNERFMQYLASRNTLFNLSNFLDKSIIQGYDMSTFIRRYSRYLNEKALSYRMVAVDFTKMKRGPEGVMRTMSSDKLLKTLPIIQNQLDVLLDFDAHPNELTNGVITSAFIHLFKDSIRLFATYNEGIINLLEKYFDMKKNQCKEGLDSYKKFLGRMAKLSEFLKVAEQIGIDQADIPDLTQAPSSLFEALEQHVASLEDRKSKEISTVYKADNLLSAVSSLTNTGKAFSRVVEPKKHTFDPQFFSQAWKEKHFRDSPVTPDGASTSGSPRIAVEKTTSASPAPELPVPLVPTPARQNTADTMGALGNSNWEMGLPPLTLPNSTYSEIPMDLEGLFETRLPEPAPVAAAWDGEFGARPCQAKSNLEFNYTVTPGTSMAQEHPGAEVNQQPESVLKNDLDTSLANLMGSLDFGTSPQKSDIQWNHQPHEKKMTGGNNWQVSSASTSSAIWNPTTITSVPNVVPAPMNYPVTTHQLPVYGMVPTPFGSVHLMTPPPLICAQPGLRAPNPFAPVSGPQNFSQNNFM